MDIDIAFNDCSVSRLSSAQPKPALRSPDVRRAITDRSTVDKQTSLRWGDIKPVIIAMGVMLTIAFGTYGLFSSHAEMRLIEQVQPGDVVLAADSHAERQQAKKVVKAYQRTADHLRILTFTTSRGETQTLKTTDEHPFWAANHVEFREAGRLVVGDQVVSPDGESQTLTATRYEPHPEGVTVYNFEVEDYHTYYVAAHGSRGPPVLVHNADCLDFANDLLTQYPDAVMFRMRPNRPARYLGDLPGYPVPGQPTSHMHQHYFLLEDGLLRDPAHLGGVPIDDWFASLPDLSAVPTDSIDDIYHFTPLLGVD